MRRTVTLVAIAAATILVVAWFPAPAGADTETFSYTGGSQTLVLPDGVECVTFDLLGAGGGAAATPGGVAGLGGRATYTTPIRPGESLQINVGGAGGDGVNTTGGAGGFNGGGAGAG